MLDFNGLGRYDTLNGAVPFSNCDTVTVWYYEKSINEKLSV